MKIYLELTDNESTTISKHMLDTAKLKGEIVAKMFIVN